MSSSRSKRDAAARKTWRTWDEPDRQVAVAQWVERNVCVVFPLTWAVHHGQSEMIARAKERIAEVEVQSGKTLAPGSVLLAFSRHDMTLAGARRLNPEIVADLCSASVSLDPSST